jgi:hypothetical protein
MPVSNFPPPKPLEFQSAIKPPALVLYLGVYSKARSLLFALVVHFIQNDRVTILAALRLMAADEPSVLPL